jgi:hypothetical protein
MKRLVPCPLCHRWVASIPEHNLKHIGDNPHAFCRTMNCGQRGCPVR